MDVYIMNIQAEQKRRYMCEGALFAMGTPFVKVKRWIAIDDLNYIKTRELLEDTIADGFPGFQSYLDRGMQNEHNIGIYGQMWNYCRFWRHVVEKNKTVMLIQDDRRFCVPYLKMIEVVEDVIRKPDFHFMSLWCKQQYIPEKNLPLRLISKESPIAYGIYEGGACAGHIVSPKGAQWLIENVIGHVPPRIEWAVLAKARDNDNFYTLVDESLNLEHLVPDKRGYLPSRILSNTQPNEYERPVYTTADDHTLAKSPK